MERNIKYVTIATDGEIDLIQPAGFEEDEEDFWYDVAIHETGEIVGEISYDDRYSDTEYMGNVSYSVFKQYRGHHYATKALKLLKDILVKAKKSEMLINISLDNEASKKTAQNFGAKLVCYRSIPKNHQLYFENSEHKVEVYMVDLEKERVK